MPDILDLDERIRLAIKIGESHYREFKSGLAGLPGNKKARDIKEVAVDVARTLVAFANADGGELLVGVEDDGTISGLPHSDEDISRILAAPETHVHADTPLPSPRRRAVEIDGLRVVYFSISKGAQFIHLTSDGRCLKRVDRESVPYAAEHIAAARLEDASRTWDREAAHASSLDDLNIDLVQSVAAQIAYGVSVEKCLQYLDLADFTPDGLRLKRAAVLLFAKDVRRWHPGCFVRVMTIQGKEKRSGEGFNVRKDEVVAGNILQLVDTAWERLTHALSTHTQLTETARFQTTMMFPQIAVREALVNAIVHRNYAIEGRGIEVSIYQDRMEILSPGMLLSTVSLEDIRSPTGAHESRNALIARVLREVGVIREMGEGVRRIFNVMRSSALAEPEFDSQTTGFNVTLFHKSLYDPKVKLWLSTFDAHKLTENQVAVLALGYGGREFSAQEIIDRLGIVDTDELQRTTTPLRHLGLLVRTRNHTQAYKYAEAKRIPKREVPTYRVASGLVSAPAQQVPIAEAERELDVPGTIYRLHLGNLPYESTKQDILTILGAHCDVQSVEIPPGHFAGQSNRGFAFATVSYDGDIQNLLSALDGQFVGQRRLRANIANPR